MKYQGCLNQNVDRHIYYFGSYSPNELDFLNRVTKALRQERDNLTFLDTGANVDQHTLFMAKRVDQVISFEPNDEVSDRLENNIHVNSLTNVNLVRCALGITESTAVLGSGLPGNSGSRSLNWSMDETKNIKIPIRNGDSVLRHIVVKSVDIIKMDVEGYEKFTLQVLSNTLNQRRPIILFEMMGHKQKSGF